MCNYPNQDLVNVDAFIKFGVNLSICSKDIEPNRLVQSSYRAPVATEFIVKTAKSQICESLPILY